MDIQVKTSHSITLVPLETKLLDYRKVYIEGTIDQQSACKLNKQLMLLYYADRNAPVDLMINSTGGDVNAGLLIYDMIRSCKMPIRTFCLGRAYSMAAIIFTAASAGRYMFPNSELMIHEPSLAHGTQGNISTIRSVSEMLIDANEKIKRIIAEHTGKTEIEIEEAISYDHYFSPEESIAFGLADKIISFDFCMEE